MTKKLRSTARQRTAPPPTMTTAGDANLKPSKSAGALPPPAGGDRAKSSKARARPALTNANSFSSSGRPAQNTATSSRSHLGAGKPPAGGGVGTRRSTRLQSGGTKTSLAQKASFFMVGSRLVIADLFPQAAVRDRRRAQTATTRSRSIESDKEEEPGGAEQAAFADSPIAESSRTATSSTPPALTAEQEQAVEEAYQIELADYHIYSVMRRFAYAARAAALYDSRLCLDELEKLPPQHQRSAWVMSMVGKAHYELGEYPAVRRMSVYVIGHCYIKDPASCLLPPSLGIG